MKKTTLPISISGLIASLSDKRDYSEEEVVDLINTASITKAELLPWADFNHPVTDGYGRAIIFANDHFELAVMTWNHRDFTAVHNHGYTKWGAVQVFGKLEHNVYELNENSISILYKEKISEGEIISVNQSLIHQMGNTSEESAISLHVYGTPEKNTGITSDTQLFEIGKHETQLIDGPVFYDLKNSTIKKRSSGLKSDRITEIVHYCSLLNFYVKTNIKGPQYNKAIKYFQDRSFESRHSFELELDNKRILYLIELKKAQNLMRLLNEPSKTLDEIILEINDMEKYS